MSYICMENNGNDTNVSALHKYTLMSLCTFTELNKHKYHKCVRIIEYLCKTAFKVDDNKVDKLCTSV